MLKEKLELSEDDFVAMLEKMLVFASREACLFIVARAVNDMPATAKKRKVSEDAIVALKSVAEHYSTLHKPERQGEMMEMLRDPNAPTNIMDELFGYALADMQCRANKGQIKH